MEEPATIKDRLGGSPGRQVCVGVLAMALGFSVYFALQTLVEPTFVFRGAWDDSIPFVPWALPVYNLFIPYALWVFWKIERRTFLDVLVAGAVACVVAWTCFCVLPAAVQRPDPEALEGPMRFVWQWTHRIDRDVHTFPSLHVAVTLLCLQAVRSSCGLVASWGVSTAIILSTLLVKQHTLLDVVGGLALGLLSWATARRLSRVDAGS